jgi:hypothetical protein
MMEESNEEKKKKKSKKKRVEMSHLHRAQMEILLLPSRYEVFQSSVR